MIQRVGCDGLPIEGRHGDAGKREKAAGGGGGGGGADLIKGRV